MVPVPGADQAARGRTSRLRGRIAVVATVTKRSPLMMAPIRVDRAAALAETP